MSQLERGRKMCMYVMYRTICYHHHQHHHHHSYVNTLKRKSFQDYLIPEFLPKLIVEAVSGIMII